MFATVAPSPAHRQPGNAYRDVAVQSRVGGDSSPHALIAMLYDGLAESIARARGALRAGQIDDKGRAISRAARIVDEGLSASLDVHGGGALAQNLRDLYAYVSARLTHANLHNDEAALAECARLIEPLRAAWGQIAPARRG
jgi:flagellar secretion chaperone FliS